MPHPLSSSELNTFISRLTLYGMECNRGSLEIVKRVLKHKPTMGAEVSAQLLAPCATPVCIGVIPYWVRSVLCMRRVSE